MNSKKNIWRRVSMKIRTCLYFAFAVYALSLQYGCGSIRPCEDTGRFLASTSALPRLENKNFSDPELETLCLSYRTKIKDARGRLSQIAEASEKFDEALAYWEKTQLGKNSADMPKVREIRGYLRNDCLKNKQIKKIAYLMEKAYQPASYTDYEKTSMELLGIFHEQRNNFIWTSSEQIRFAEKAGDVESAYGYWEKSYEEILRKYKYNLYGTQIAFLNEKAHGDYKNAYLCYKNEKMKWCNWIWMGCPRDNKDVIVNSILICDRIIKTSRLERSFVNDAVNLRENLLDRLNKSWKEKYSSRPALPDYELLAGYPAGKSEDLKVLALADKEWLCKYQSETQGSGTTLISNERRSIR